MALFELAHFVDGPRVPAGRTGFEVANRLRGIDRDESAATVFLFARPFEHLPDRLDARVRRFRKFDLTIAEHFDGVFVEVLHRHVAERLVGAGPHGLVVRSLQNQFPHVRRPLA
ncbi:MAG: hypothetical protein AB7K64_12395 [Variibacter sp.]